ncbi:hypothetical protein [Natrinema salinisoli]|uniref:hypothetical protein n=1 Tax=Natrinema salinisoli TaxID=2878535 RepID=UPI001CF046AD|nr:hypothetical protein [Natrinema salinisoli]
MSTNESHGNETDGSPRNQPARTTVPVPVTVPESVEHAARERHERAKQQEHTFDLSDERLQLEDYLRDYVAIEPQFLTRDVTHTEYGEPLTRALYTCVTEDQYEAIVDAVNVSEDAANVQEFVRNAVSKSLSESGL